MMGLRREHMVLFFKRIGFIEVRKRVAKNKTKNYCYGNGFLLLLLLLEDKPWNFGIHWIIIIVVYFLFREKIIINFSRKNSHCWRSGVVVVFLKVVSCFCLFFNITDQYFLIRFSEQSIWKKSVFKTGHTLGHIPQGRERQLITINSNGQSSSWT